MSARAAYIDTADLGNAELRRLALLAALGAPAAWLAGGAARAWWPAVFAPGAPLMQMTAIAGAVLLLVAFAAALAKRTGAAARRGFRVHVRLAVIGLVLAAAHAGGALAKPAMALLAVLAALAVLGVWARTRGAVAMGQVFGTKLGGFTPPAGSARDALRELAAAKRSLLARLDPDADERLFAPSPRHWLRAPRLTASYTALARRESALTGARGTLGPALARWRAVHQVLAWCFVLGLAVHVVLVLFFAGYVADGRAVYWWHVTAWTL